jgi:hypothetical protein
VIVVIGTPRFAHGDANDAVATGRAVAVADGAVVAGATVEIAGRIGNDADGDAVVLDLSRRGVGHAALLRVGGLPTSAADGTAADIAAADLELALRYLPAYRVVVVAEHLDPAALSAAADAAAWAEAHLILILDPDERVPASALPSAATILEAPAWDADDAFAALVGAYAAALDRGEEPGAAFADQAARFNPERLV